MNLHQFTLPDKFSRKNDALISRFRRGTQNNGFCFPENTSGAGRTAGVRHAKSLQAIAPEGFRDPDAIRTHDRQLRRLMLYPAELPDRLLAQRAAFCRGLLIARFSLTCPDKLPARAKLEYISINRKTKRAPMDVRIESSWKEVLKEEFDK